MMENKTSTNTQMEDRSVTAKICRVFNGAMAHSKASSEKNHEPYTANSALQHRGTPPGRPVEQHARCE